MAAQYSFIVDIPFSLLMITNRIIDWDKFLLCWLWRKGAFERRRYMNVVVQRACHPQLRYYIHATVSGLLPFIQKVGLL
jgi:hypothetical protein